MLCLFPIFVHANDPFPTTAEPQPSEILATALVNNPATGDLYQIVLVKPDVNNFSVLKIYLIQSLSLTAITDTNLRFVVILPDGNFHSLVHNDSYSGSYSKNIRLQKSLENPPVSLNTNNLSAWLLKKNDPTPPPPPSAGRVAPIGSDLLPPGGSVMPKDYKNVVPFYNSASDYLNTDEAIKIGTLWPPWANPDGYYYIVVSYSKKAQQNSVEHVTIGLERCFDNTGYAIDSFFYFSPAQGWIGSGSTYLNTAISSSLITITTDKLGADEVRHIYYRLKRVGDETKDRNAEYKAYLVFNNIGPLPPGPAINRASDVYVLGVTYNTGCYNISLKTTPHDPNIKIPSTEVCTANGTGEVIYIIHFQNEGRGWAKDVVVYDSLPKYIDTNSVVFIGSSSKCTFSKSNNHLLFRLDDIYLPGTSQSAPRYFADSETKGWVQFSCTATCPEVGQTIDNRAGIVFFDVDSRPQKVVMTPKSTIVPDTILRPEWTISPSKP